MAASRPVSRWPYLTLILLLLLGIPGAEGQELLQPQGSISVLIGENLTLECRVSPTIFNPAGPVKWFLGKGPTRTLIYSDTRPSARVTRAEPGSNNNFTISIHNIVPEDAGTYYCVKQRGAVDQDWLSGGRGGTEVAVKSVPKVRIETNPTSPVHLNDSVTITCSVDGFYPNDISLVWLENGRETDPGMGDSATQNQDQTFALKSALEVVVTKQRSLSVFTCQLRQNARPLVNVDWMPRVGAQPGEDGNPHFSGSGRWMFSSLWAGLFLGKAAAALFLLYLFLRMRKERSSQSRVGATASRKAGGCASCPCLWLLPPGHRNGRHRGPTLAVGFQVQ